ncbi:neprilysin-2-like [Oppia nitens]|uniref:neprilysin-2-like n=1 Tax=Oppia nitens TaxID=1686743 RepID=UPI0023DB094B|nr:neprilysin-2-like [Oppia nitens]
MAALTNSRPDLSIDLVLQTDDNCVADCECFWWRMRTRMEKTLLCGWAIISVVFFALCIAIIALISTQNYFNKTSVCLSDSCIHSASRIIQWMDESVSPCDHFYRFACGKWYDSTVIPDNSNSVSSFTQLTDVINIELKDLLSQSILSSDSKIIKNMKIFYNSCMNLTAVNNKSLDTLMNYIKELGGWPVLEGNHWKETNFNFINTTLKLKNFGFNPNLIFQLRVAPNVVYNGEHMIYITELKFSPLAKNELLNVKSRKMKAYLDFIVDIAVLLGADEDKAYDELEKVIQLESLLAKVIEMYENIRFTLKQKFQEIDWMDIETKSSALFKIDYINHFIAYNNEILNDKQIEDMNQMLEDLESNNLLENLLKLQKMNLNNEYSKLYKSNYRNDWQKMVTPVSVNAYYSPFINAIRIPIWIIKGIFFEPNRPNYLNYGALGWILGHELIHEFDTFGGQFDKSGNLRDWWDHQTKLDFNKRAQCFVNQYKQFNLSKSTLSEDIADNGGIDTAFKSYQYFVKRNGEELPLPGLNYTSEQLFWISAANQMNSSLLLIGQEKS